VQFRELVALDCAHLESFRCATPDSTAPAYVAQHMINVELPIAIRSEYDPNTGVGGWIGSELVGVAAWRPDFHVPEAWRISVLGVSANHQGNRYGEETKLEVARLGREAGMRALVSLVSVANGTMIRLNDRMGDYKAEEPPRNPEDPDEERFWVYTYVL
jgi:hypothetical protein